MGVLDTIARWFGRRPGKALAPRLSDRELARVQKRVIANVLKRSFTPGDLLTSTSRSADFTDFNVAEAVEKGLEASIYVYACMRRIADTVKTIPIEVERLDAVSADWVKVPQNELDTRGAKLRRLLARPNEEWSWPTFAAMWSGQITISSESYIAKIRSTIASEDNVSLAPFSKGKPLPIALWAHDASKFGPVRGARSKGQPFVVSYQAQRSGLDDVAPEDMIHTKDPHPFDPWHGLGPMRPAMREVDIEREAQEHQKISLENRAVPDGILTIKDGALMSDEQYEETRKNFKARFQGAANSHEPLLLDFDVHWQDLAKTMMDLDFMNGRRLTREGIANAFGVPPVLVGILDRATYSNYQTALEFFWTFVTIPMLDNLIEDFNAFLVPEFGPDLRIVKNVSGVDALYPMFSRRMTDAISFQGASGAPWNIVSEIFRLGLPAWPGWDQPTVARGVPDTDRPATLTIVK